MIIGIIAIAKNFAIGKDGRLPWHYSSDLKHFKETTTGNAIVMGSTTWNSLSKPLPNRLNIVLSRTIASADREDILTIQLKDQVRTLWKYLDCDVYIIGGAKTFASFAEDIEKWIVTRIPVNVDDADVFMPENFLDGFELQRTKDLDEGLLVEYFERSRT
ncbi:MAG TPA: dihydrofolate reductase [Pyrinomonadaceae bacterium]|nr:dihydrofolate reductase [Pyrinomonadaceae bacterium]